MRSVIRQRLFVWILFVLIAQGAQAFQPPGPDATVAEDVVAAESESGPQANGDEVVEPRPQADNDDEITAGEAFLLKLKQGVKVSPALLREARETLGEAEVEFLYP